MKTRILIFLSLICWWACKPSVEEATKYNDTLLSYQKPVALALKDLEASLQDTLYENIAAKKDALKKTLHDNINALKEQPDFDKKALYKTAVLNYLLEVNSLADNEYQEILNLMLKPKAEFTKEDQNKNEKLRKLVVGKYAIAESHLKAAQEDFALTYELNLGK